MKKVIISFVCALFLFASTNTKADEIANAPIPFEKIGLGVKVGNSGYGGNFAYAIQKNFHIGTGLGLSFTTGDAGGTSLFINPFFRYLFENEGNLFPFAEFNFAFSEYPIATFSTSSSSANIELGGMWFPLPSVSVGASINVLSFDIDSSNLGFGIGQASMMINWWM